MSSIRKLRESGSGIITESWAVPVGESYRVVSGSCVFDIAPTTSENLTLTLDAVGGPQYDVLLYSVDPAAGATTDILWQPDQELFLIGGDALKVDYAGTDGRGWGLELTLKAVP